MGFKFNDLSGFLSGEPMCNHTTFKIGGCADYFITVNNTDELISAVKAVKNADIPLTVIGKGSNILVSDDGIDGAVICLSGNNIELKENKITAFAGVSLASLCKTAQGLSFTGLEFAYGIPASVGGAVYMNAGAYGGSISDVLYSVTAVDPDGNLHEFYKGDFNFAYRHSVFMENDLIIVSATFELKNGDAKAISDKMEELISKRRDKQPLNFPSAGSTFKRPEGNFAGALIEKSGLKGKKIGGAEVSTKHAGFIVNSGNATASDVMNLVKFVTETVYKDSGVMLEPEIKIIGR